MRWFLIEYVDPRTRYVSSVKREGKDKTSVRDAFWEEFPLFEIERITWIPSTNKDD